MGKPAFSHGCTGTFVCEGSNGLHCAVSCVRTVLRFRSSSKQHHRSRGQRRMQNVGEQAAQIDSESTAHIESEVLISLTSACVVLLWRPRRTNITKHIKSFFCCAGRNLFVSAVHIECEPKYQTSVCVVVVSIPRRTKHHKIMLDVHLPFRQRLMFLVYC